MVCKWASERATRERNTSIRLGIGNSDGGEDTKEDGAEESGNEIHIEKAQGSKFEGSKKVVGWFYGRTLPLRNGQAKSVLTLDMAEIRGKSARVEQIPGKPGKLVQPFKRSPGISEINQAFL